MALNKDHVPGVAQGGCAADREGQAMVVVERWVAKICICVWEKRLQVGFIRKYWQFLTLFYHLHTHNYFYSSLECKMKPTVVSDPLNWDSAFNWDSVPGQHGANNTFTNTDKPNVTANWMGKNQIPAHFIYSLGCHALISKVAIRNSCNGFNMDRLVCI